MPLGMSIYESGRPIQHAYFPTTAIVSLLYETEDGDSAEIAIVGNDGVVGISLFLVNMMAKNMLNRDGTMPQMLPIEVSSTMLSTVGN